MQDHNITDVEPAQFIADKRRPDNFDNNGHRVARVFLLILVFGVERRFLHGSFTLS